MKSSIKFFTLASCAILFFSNCTKDRTPIFAELDAELTKLITAKAGSLSYYVLPDETDLDNIPQDPKNPLSQAKVDLGKFLFFDTGLAQDAMFPSGMGTYSCATCHIPEAGFRPGNFQGIADGGVGFGDNGEKRRMNTEYAESDLDVQSARPLNILNVAYVKNTMWNGSFGATHVNADYEDVWGIADAKTKINHLGFEGIESTNLEGIKVHRISANKELLTELGYIELFDAAFPEVAGQDTLYSTDYAALALSAYIRTLMSHKAPFQQWLKGNNDALSLEEKKGAILFFSKANCSRCHFEQNLGSHEFHVLGVKDMFQRDGYNNNPNDLRNLGRAGFTMDDEDLYKFKVPGIYNMDDTRSYFHGASANTLREVLEYKIAAVSENPIISNSLLSPKFEPLTLTEQEISHLEAFLVTGLRDPDLIRFKPDNVPSGQCFPNADPSSIVDLGCQ